MTIRTRSHLAFTLAVALGGVLVAGPAAATTFTIDANTCTNTLGGTWSFPGPVCIFSNLSVAAADTVTVPAMTHLTLNGATINRGTIEIQNGAFLYIGAGHSLENRGEVDVLGEFDNYGDVENLTGGGIFVNDGSLLNEGTIQNSDPGTYLSNFRGLINNYGAISNADSAAVISNHTLAFLKNRGGTLDVGTGTLDNDDQGTVTNVNHGLLTIGDSGAFNNFNSSVLLNRALGEVVNDGTFLNWNSAIIENHGSFENRSQLSNSAWAVVSNELDGTFTNFARFDNFADGQLENLGLFETPGDLDNACDGSLTNFGLAVLNGAFENWGGVAVNLGTWNPGPTQRACDFTPP